MVAGKPVWTEFVWRPRETRRRGRDLDRGLGDTAFKSCIRLHVMKNRVLTLNLFLQQKSCSSMGHISLDTKNNTFVCVLIVFTASEIDASELQNFCHGLDLIFFFLSQGLLNFVL